MTLHNEENTKLFLTTMTTKVKNRKYTHEDIETLLQLAESLAMDVRFERSKPPANIDLIRNLMHISRGTS